MALDPTRFTCTAFDLRWGGKLVNMLLAIRLERIIDDIEQLQEMFEASDRSPQATCLLRIGGTTRG